MKTPEQLKGAIRNIADEKNLKSQEVLQMYLFERILERLAHSKYRENFILKGGLLISSIIGVSERTTMDMDTTVRGIEMSESEITAVVKDIINIDVSDGIQFLFEYIEPIREDDDYNNFRVHLTAKYGKINAPMKIDITTGDAITPAAICYSYPLSFEKRSIPVMAYNLETIIAEKYETIIRRNIGTTRARDFYDLHMLYQLRKNDVQPDILRLAVEQTAKKRGSLDELDSQKDILQEIREESAISRLWENYVRANSYVHDLSFSQVMDTAEEIANLIE